MTHRHHDLTRYGHIHVPNETSAENTIDKTQVSPIDDDPAVDSRSNIVFDATLGGFSVGLLTERFLQAVDVSDKTSLITGLGAGLLMGAGVAVHHIMRRH